MVGHDSSYNSTRACVSSRDIFISRRSVSRGACAMKVNGIFLFFTTVRTRRV